VTSNEEKDHFMNTVFANTSLLWAYHAIHPQAGAAKADIWRYCVLWTYGIKVYMRNSITALS
jgi:mannosyltransferase OCH1-like enzyme